MTSLEFIEQEYRKADGKEKWCSSIFKNSDGNIFSYGYHYPLLFRVADMDFVNTAGYSTTTAKHIGWAKAAVGYKAHEVVLDSKAVQVIRSSMTTDLEKLTALKRCLQVEYAKYSKAMEAKKRTDTQVYRSLGHQADNVLYILSLVSGALSEYKVLQDA